MLTLSEILKACGGTLRSTLSDRTVTNVSIDSRTVCSGDLFIALKGDRFDGHDFLDDVFKKGAAVAVVDRAAHTQYPLLLVSDTLKAFQQIAHFYRAKFSIPVVAVTGSAGKTTTKESIGLALSSRFKTRVGFGNFNNHIGVPLNLFKMSHEDEVLVLELGANHPGEIKTLVEIAAPSFGVITGVYPVHLEGFGSLEQIYKTKLELADYIATRHGTMVVNGDDPELMKQMKTKTVQLITFGKSAHCDYRLSRLAVSDGKIEFLVNNRIHFSFKGYGAFNAMNALAGVAVAGCFGFDLQMLAKDWNELPSIANRFQIECWESGDYLIVDDAYNANPISFEHAVNSFKELAGERRKLIIAGDMLELGEKSRQFHESLGLYLAQQKIDLLIAAGPMSRYVVDQFSAAQPKGGSIHFDQVDQAIDYISKEIKPGDAVLIKGSHGIGLHQLKNKLKERFRSTTTV